MPSFSPQRSSRSPLERDLVALRSLLLEMAQRVDEQVADAINSLLQGDEDLAEQVVARDKNIDALQLHIDRQCERILALHAPVAVDLRKIIMAVKINADFERIGDHCRNLARHVRHTAAAPRLLEETELPRMSDMARCMLREVESAFLEQDRLKARKVIARDLQVNRMHDDTCTHLISVCREEQGRVAEAAAHLITASKSLERISDHAKNIAKNVVFMIEGTDIRHQNATD